MRCKSCKEPCAEVFCSNRCARKHKGRSLCAVCDSTNATTELCSKCRNHTYNRGWGRTKPEEKKIGSAPANFDEFAAGSNAREIHPTERPTTRLALNAMRLLLAGGTHAEVARSLECSKDYVKDCSSRLRSLLRGQQKKNKKNNAQ